MDPQRNQSLERSALPLWHFKTGPVSVPVDSFVPMSPLTDTSQESENCLLSPEVGRRRRHRIHHYPLLSCQRIRNLVDSHNSKVRRDRKREVESSRTNSGTLGADRHFCLVWYTSFLSITYSRNTLEASTIDENLDLGVSR